MNPRDICMQLLAAQSEEAVTAIIRNDPVFNEPSNWHPLDGRETNFNVTANQASDGGKALTELMTNMVDAVLLKKAYEAGIDPKSASAPATMYDAVDGLVKNMHGGKLTNLDRKDPWLLDFAQKNLCIGISGAKTQRTGLPCYTFVDNGEGQHPNDFESTFLSLSAGNKKSIHFVQGKFNMGSSGVLSYCGRCWYKLTVSRKYDGTGPWGWTLIRRRPGNTEDLPVAEFFKMPDGSIPQFDAGNLYPMLLADGQKYQNCMLKTGTVIKLFDYQVGSTFRTGKGAREALNEHIVESILPFRLYDLRATVDKERGSDRALGVDARPFYGMEFLLLDTHAQEVGEEDVSEAGDADSEDDGKGLANKRIFVGSYTDPTLGTFSVSAIKLGQKLPEWLKKTNNRVFHAVNGQVQYKQTRGFLSQTCKFPALMDRSVILVDASRLTFHGHNEVWKGDRENIRTTIDGERYKQKVIEVIKSSDALKTLQKEIADEELARTTQQESNSLFQQLVDEDQSLAGLLTDKLPVIRLPSSGGTEDDADSSGQSGERELKYSPTFLTLEERQASGITVSINKNRPLRAKTDVVNDYFNRTENPGTAAINHSASDKFAMRTTLRDGNLTVFLTPEQDKVSVGDRIPVSISLVDPAMPEAVSTNEVVVEITAAESKAKPKRKSKQKSDLNDKSGKGGNSPGGGEPAPTHGLPAVKLLTQDGRPIAGYDVEQWPEDFDEYEGGIVQDLGDSLIYKINYDNAFHLKYRASQRGQTAKDAVSEKYILGMRILMLGFQQALIKTTNSTNSDSDTSGAAEYYDLFRQICAKGASSTVIALAETLPKIVDAASQKDDAE